MSIEFIHSEAMAYMATVGDNTFDSSPTDPPYGLKFMGKAWDHSVPGVEFWREHLRVMKPGAYILVACGTRTQHRMAVNIEDAGYEIRDVITWHYGQGFPKSLDVSKAIDKLKGVEFESIPASGVGFMNAEGSGGYNVTKNQMIRLGDTSEAAKQWDGWGTALKPATEFWTLARKPLEGTVAENVLKWGTGGINIAASKIGYQDEDDLASATWGRGTDILSGNYVGATHGNGKTDIKADPQGRWPANVIFDEYTGGLLDEQTGTLTSGKPSGIKKGQNLIFSEMGEIPVTGFGDSGGASRFFYCPKPSPGERNKGLEKWEKSYSHRENGFSAEMSKTTNPRQNHHPTVKPIDLMRYFVRLITPPGGVCFDPFNGSGTTGIACKLEGMNYVGTDMSLEYIEMSRVRCAAYHRENTQLGLGFI